MSRQSASRRKRENAAFEAFHAPDPSVLKEFNARAVARMERDLEREARTLRREAGTVYHATPYGKYFTPAKQAERDEKQEERRKKREQVYLQGGFVSESHFVAYVKRLIQYFNEDTDGMLKAMKHTIDLARLSWEADKINMLIGRAESWAEWLRARDSKGVNDPECGNETTAEQRAYQRMKTLRAGIHTATGQHKFADARTKVGVPASAWEHNVQQSEQSFRDAETMRGYQQHNALMREERAHPDTSEMAGWLKMRETFFAMARDEEAEAERQSIRYNAKLKELRGL